MTLMDETEAYEWVGQVTRHIDDIVEPHIGQRLADDVVAVIMKAYKRGRKDEDEVNDFYYGNERIEHE